MSRFDHALVIGGGIAGLMAARVLSGHARQVTLVERDSPGQAVQPRPGTPQARHVHGLLARGLALADHYFPGFEHDLIAAGAPRAEWMWDTLQHIPNGWTPRFHSGIISRPVTRPLIEALMRRRVAALPNVRFDTGWQVDRLLGDARRVTGVSLIPRHAGAGDARALAADLVVDASGRSSRAPGWLAALGVRPPPEIVIDAHLRYATREYALEQPPPFVALLALPWPHMPRGGVLTQVENGRWLLTLAGYGDDVPPTDAAAFEAYIASLPLPPLHQALAGARPVSAVCGYAHTANRWRRFERVALPAGFIALGDAVCALNPVYGQGMTVSMLTAQALDEMLAAHGGQAGWERRFQRRLVRVCTAAWMMATSEDRRFPGCEGVRFSPVAWAQQRYLDALFAAAPRSPVVTQGLLETMHLLRGPYSLLRPAMLREVAGAARGSAH